MNKIKNVWVTWHYQARSRNLAKVFNLHIYEYFRNKNIIERHLLSSIWTIKILLKTRPIVIFIQYSYLLLVIVALYKRIKSNVLLITDCHTKALRRKATGIFSALFWKIKKWSFKYADITIISNEGLIKDITELHSNFIILPDKIPEQNPQKKQSEYDKYCVYISSFAVDEPFDEVLQASGLLKNKLKIYWTGKYSGKVIEKKDKFTNVEFTGYLSFEDYYSLIGNADCLLALTTEEDCLQSGAYEALTLEVPIVVSNTEALKQYFQDAAVYTKHNPGEIANSIKYAIDNKERIKENIVKIKKLRNNEFYEIVEKVKNILKEFYEKSINKKDSYSQ